MSTSYRRIHKNGTFEIHKQRARNAYEEFKMKKEGTDINIIFDVNGSQISHTIKLAYLLNILNREA